MFSNQLRLVVAAIVGVFFDAVFFCKFQPYTAREHGHDLLPWYCLPVLALATGFLLTLGMAGKIRWVPIAMVGGFSAANACLIAHDCAADPTNHNLWPFEFAIIAVGMSPAFLGAGTGKMLGRRGV